MWPFNPRHTVQAVAKSLADGLRNGSIVLDFDEIGPSHTLEPDGFAPARESAIRQQQKPIRQVVEDWENLEREYRGMWVAYSVYGFEGASFDRMALMNQLELDQKNTEGGFVTRVVPWMKPQINLEVSN